MRMPRLPATRLALSVVALSLLALAMMAIPLWYGWRDNLSTFRAYVQDEDLHAFAVAYEKTGRDGLIAFVAARSAGLPAGEILLLTDSSKARLAGNLPAWPSQVPDAPGTYGVVVEVGGGAAMRVVASQLRLPDGFRLLVGRESVRFESLVERFWIGIASAMAVILALGLGIGWSIHRRHFSDLCKLNKSLTESETRYELASTASKEGFWDWVVATDTFYTSPRLLEIYGFPPDTAFAGRADFLTRFPFHPEDRPKWKQAATEHFAGRTARFEIEMRLLRNGETRWIHLTGLCTRNPAGEVVRWTGSTLDVTERKQAEEALLISEQRYALAMEAAGDGHTNWILATDQFYASPRALEICGFPPGTNFANRTEWAERFPFHPEDRVVWVQALRRYLAHGIGRFEMEVRILLRGEVRWLSFRAMCSLDEAGVVAQLSGAITDITERKTIEGAMRRSETYLEEALRVGHAGSFAYGVREARQVHWSPTTYDLFDCDPELGLPSAETLWRRIHSEDVAAVKAARAKAIEAKTEYSAHFRVVRRDGTIRHLHSAGRPWLDAEGKVTELVGVVTDITERKLAADALRKSEQRYALTLEATEEGHFDVNVDTDELFSSERLNVMYGFPPGTRSLKHSEYLKDFHFYGDDAEVYRSAIRAAEAAGGAERHEFEYRILRPSGELRWLRTRGKVTRDAEGRARRRTGMVADITEAKLVAEALREGEARFRTLTGLSSDWFWRQDENLRFTHFSEEAPAKMGYAASASIGRARWELTITPLSSTWEEHRAVLAAHQPFRDFEYSRRNDAGETVYLSESGAPVFDNHGRFLGYEGVGRNITDRKRIEAELHSRQEMLDLAQKAARAVAFDWHIDTAEGENRWSPDLEVMYGLKPGSYDGSFKGWKALILPEDWPLVRDAVLRANETGDVAAEYRVMHTGGIVRWLQAKGRMIFDAAGRPQRLIGFMLDVTDRHEAEEGMRRLEQQLRQAQRMESMGTLAGGIAHDFNNILGAILGYGEMALRGAPKGSRLRRDLESITAAGERGRALVERILAFSRSGVGERVDVHVERVVIECVDLLSAGIPQGIAIETELLAGRAAMRGDPTQVHQVVMNLATNGIQSMERGGTLRVSLAALRLDQPRTTTTGTVAPGDYLLLQVADEGSGISAKIIERIFDPFFTTKEVGVGTGLGLSLVHGIVTDVGGAIDIRTAQMEGSIFAVYLPRSGDVAAQPQDEPAEVPHGNFQRVLVVDDEEPLVRLATRTLEDLGYVPVPFTSSREALAAFRADPRSYDVLITDERMPGLSGSALIREVRGIRRGMPILLVSGYLGSAVVTRAYNAGADVVLKKPLSARELALSLARVLQA